MIVLLVAGIVLLVVFAAIFGRHAQRHGYDRRTWGALFALTPPIAMVGLLAKRRIAASQQEVSSEPATTYRLYAGWRIQIVVMMIAFGGVMVFALTMSALGERPGWAFASVWSAAYAWVAYGLLWKIPYEVRIEGQTLTWRTPIHRGSRRLNEVRKLQPYRWGSGGAVIEFVDGRRVIVLMQRGFVAFAAELARQLPGVPINYGRLGDWTDRWSRGPLK